MSTSRQGGGDILNLDAPEAAGETAVTDFQDFLKKTNMK